MVKVNKRRRREGKTDYRKRLKLLSGEFPRVIFRKTNKYIIGQYITSKGAQDEIKIGVNSKELTKYGWPKEFEGSLKSIPASYLTGMLIGRKIIDKNLGKLSAIIDFGMYRSIHKTKAYAFLKGLIDAGIEIKAGEKGVFPDENRIKGKYLKEDFSKIFEKIKSQIQTKEKNG